MESLALLKANHIDFNVLTVLTSELSKHPKELYDFYKDHDLRFVQLIPCLPGLDGKENAHALKPSEFASFYQGILFLYGLKIIKEDIISASHCLITSFRCFGDFHLSNAECWVSAHLNMSLRRMAMSILVISMFWIKYVCGNVCSHSFDQIRNSLIMNGFPKRR
jgi:hypothetical protein